MNVVHRSIFFSAIERYGTVFFFIITAAVLSRLLTPQEFGIYALINAAIGMTTAIYQEFGGANYLIQKQSLSEEDTRTAFTITLCLSALSAFAFFELRNVAADFFSEPQLSAGFAVATLNFVLIPFSITISALLRRDMAFAVLARSNIVGSFVTATTSIVFAVLKYSFMAPILGTIFGNVAILALLIASWKNLRIFKPSLSEYGDVAAFGVYSSGTAIINVLYNLAPQFILARILDFGAVGLYSRANNMTQVFDKFIVQIFNPVLLPAISAHTRAGKDLKGIFLKAVELIAVLQWPFLIFFALMADQIVLIWLGQSWYEIVPLVRMLCIASLFMFAASLTYPILVASGNIRDTLYSSLISLPPSLLLLFFTSFYGLHAVAASALVALPFQALVALYFVGRRLELKAADVFRAVAKSSVVTACTVAAIVISMTVIYIAMIGPIVGLILALGFAAMGWLVGLVVTQHPLLTHIHLIRSGIAAFTTRLRGNNRNIATDNLL